METRINDDLAIKHYPENLLGTMHYFRNIALEIDNEPENILQHLNCPGINNLCFDRESDCLSRTKLLEALSYGDAGVLLACPGPSLSGLMVRELGNHEQKEYFFNLVEKNKATTFLAVTEPGKGSDAGQMRTILKKVDDNHYEIHGEKWLVGHGADAEIGILVARTSFGPLGVTAVLLTPELLHNDGNVLYKEHLDMIGLCGARLSRLVFNGLKIHRSHILGHHLSPIKRGMMAVMKTFNRMRPGVAAFALGQAQATLDYVKVNRILTQQQMMQMQLLDAEVMATRLMVYQAAVRVNQDSEESAYASVAKAKATEVAEKVIKFAIQLFGASYLKHPLLVKWQRDAYGYEYMEGTSDIQFKHVCQGYMNQKFDSYFLDNTDQWN
jgi:alkylation response protein AidB-like acyl-CoA dehydrogenase